MAKKLPEKDLTPTATTDASAEIMTAGAADEISAQSLHSLVKSYNAWLDGACQVQAEMLEFFNRRIRADIELPAQLAKCTTPADMIEHQMSFAKTMLQDYSDESQKLYELMTEATLHVSDEVDQAFTDPLPH